MRLRTVTGNRYETPCQCGCSGLVPKSDTVKVVIDLDLPSGKRTYLFAHSPDAGKWKGNGGIGSSTTSAPSNGGNGHSAGFTPASALPSAPPKAPEPPAHPYGPSPVPLALLGSAGASEPSPNPNSGATWATSSLTFNAGAYESAKSGFADFAKPGETPEALRQRVNAVVLSDIEFQVRAMRELHERLGDVPVRTSSPAPRAGAPSGFATPPRMIVPSATPTVGEASPGPCPSAVGAGPGPSKASAQNASGERPLKVLVHEVRLDLSDADPLRLSRKMKVWVDWLGKRGYTSANDVRPGDEWALERVLGDFESVNRGGRP